MFVGSKNDLGLWESNLVGNKFRIVLINIIQMLVYSRGCKFTGKGYPQKTRTLQTTMMIPQFIGVFLFSLYNVVFTF